MNENRSCPRGTNSAESAVTGEFPQSRRVYLTGSRPDLRVPMREILLTGSPRENGSGEHASIHVYDTAGPYGDGAFRCDIRSGLPGLRENWIAERYDTETSSDPELQSEKSRCAGRGSGEGAFPVNRAPRRSRSGCPG